MQRRAGSHGLGIPERDLDPDLRTQLFAGQINRFTCTSCPASALLVSTLMYHDMRRQICRWYHPFVLLQDPQSLSQFATDGRLALEWPALAARKMPEYFRNPFVVFHPDELLRQIEFRETLYARDHPDAGARNPDPADQAG